MSVLYDFDEVIDRQGSDSIKWHLYERGVLPMWVADMDFRAAEPVLQALRERVDHGVFGYPEMGSRNTSLMSELSQVIVERMARLYNWEIQPDDLVFVPGVVTGFNLACHALAAPDGGVFVQTPVYYPMLHAAADTGSIHQEMQLTLDPDGTYSVDWELFERSLDERTRLFILCNP
ncbi:MAG: putative C-S lyase, partial [Anaerolineales bacterium]|nr:putative C-S lyase [Anaerolineales bacterium]